VRIRSPCALRRREEATSRASPDPVSRCETAAVNKPSASARTNRPPPARERGAGATSPRAGRRSGKTVRRRSFASASLPLLATAYAASTSLVVDSVVWWALPTGSSRAILLAEENRIAIEGVQDSYRGETRTDSVRAVVAEVPEDAAAILVHDQQASPFFAARKLVPRLLDGAVRLRRRPCPARRFQDTVKRRRRRGWSPRRPPQRRWWHCRRRSVVAPRVARPRSRGG